jgi:hypothetical protein
MDTGLALALAVHLIASDGMESSSQGRIPGSANESRIFNWHGGWKKRILHRE